jgi:hypothetical protein
MWRAATCVLVMTICGAAAAVSAGSGEPGYHGRTPAPGDVAETQFGASGGRRVGDARVRIGVLSRSRREEDIVDRLIANGPLLDDSVADLSRSRRVRVGASHAWIAPSANGEAVCLIAPGELACPGASVIERDGADPGVFWHADGPIRVAGIAADVVTSVTVIYTDGARRAASVDNNAFVVADPRAPRQVAWTGPDGPERVTFPAGMILGR